MSSVYSSDPATRGKVILHTSAGDLELELWSKESPLACRNFVQLCMEGYYNNCLFHRIIRDFIVQTGDPKDNGGESIYGKPFKDEFHSRLRFSRRGIVAMASTGPDSNLSQFFITLDEASDLNGKHTIFAKVVGDTIYNLLKLGQLETDKNERPLYKAVVSSTTVLANPFDDIVPREFAPIAPVAAVAPIQKKVLKSNKALLSFDDHDQKSFSKIKSTHDALSDPSLSKEPVAIELIPKQPSPSVHAPSVTSEDEESLADSDPTESNISSLKSKVEQLKHQIKNINAPKQEQKQKQAKKQSQVDQFRRQYLESGRGITRLQKHRQDTLGQLANFKNVLKQAYSAPRKEQNQQVVQHDDWECDLHFVKNCESCKDTFGLEDNDDDEGWMTSTLKFKKPVSANVFEPKIDDYTVIDPRLAYLYLMQYIQSLRSFWTRFECNAQSVA